VSDTSLDPILVSVKDAARVIGVSPWVVYQQLDAGAIESRYVGRRRLVVVESLRRYVDGLPTTAPEDAESH
jgi:hypothetical protein